MADHRYGDRNRDRSSSIFSDDDRDDRWRSDSSRGGGDRGRMSGQSYGSGGEPSRGGDWNRNDRGSDDDRGFFSRAGDEIRSWLGDEEAERRREADARRWEQEQGTSGGYRGGGHEDQWTGRQQGGSQDRFSQRSQMRSNTSGSGGYGEDRQSRGYGQGGYGGDRVQQGGAYGAPARQQGSQPEFRSGSGMGQGFGQPGQAFGQSGQSFGQSGQGSEQSFGGSPHDQSYRRWREQQIAQLDAEYDEYCRHRQQQFEQEFSTFRQTRQSGGQMMGGQAHGQGSGEQMGAGSGGASGQQNAGSITSGGGSSSAATASTGSSNPAAESGDETSGGQRAGTRSAKKG